jgi:SSS family solute:Na+ symporter
MYFLIHCGNKLLEQASASHTHLPSLMLVTGKLYPMQIPCQQKTNNIVDIQPWKNRHYYSVILLALMKLVFIIFSPMGLAK